MTGEADSNQEGSSTVADSQYPDPLPRSYGELQAFIETRGDRPFDVRLTTINRIQSETNRPLLCYATQTSDLSAGYPTSIDDGDLIGFSDLIDSVAGTKADVFVISNG